MQPPKRRWLRWVILSLVSTLYIGIITVLAIVLFKTQNFAQAIATLIGGIAAPLLFALMPFAQILLTRHFGSGVVGVPNTLPPHIQQLEHRTELVQRAEQVYRTLQTDEDRHLMLRIFSELVHLGDRKHHIPDSRPRLSLRSLMRNPDDHDERIKIEEFVRHLAQQEIHLLTIYPDVTPLEDMVEIADDALLQWEQLQQRLEKDRSFLTWYQELKRQVQTWIDSNSHDIAQRNPELLLKPGQLFDAEIQKQQYLDRLNVDTEAFIYASREFHEQETERLQSLLKQSEQYRQEAERQRQILFAQGLALLSGKIRHEQPQELERSVLLAVESLKRFHSLDADTALREGLAQLGRKIGNFDYNEPVFDLSWSGDGLSVAIASGEKVYVWKVTQDSDKQHQQIEFSHRDEVRAVNSSHDGRYLATIDAGGIAHLWDTWDWRPRITDVALNHPGRVRIVQFSPDGNFLVTADDDKVAIIWQAETATRFRELTHASSIKQMAFSPNGQWLVTINQTPNMDVQVWDITNNQPPLFLPHTTPYRPHKLSFSPDGQKVSIITGDYIAGDYTLEVYRVRTGELLHQLLLPKGLETVAFSPNGLHLAAVSKNSAQIWNTVEGYPLFSTIRQEKSIKDVVFSQDGSLLVTSSDDHSVRVWEVSSGYQLASFPHKDDIQTIKIGGPYVATVSTNHCVSIWETTRGDQKIRLEHTDRVNNVHFLAKVGLVATASDDGTARIWKFSNGEEVVRIENQDISHSSLHSPKIKMATSSPDGTYLAIACDDGTVRIWNILRREELPPIFIEQAVNAIAFSPDGCFLATASNDSVIKVRNMKNGDVMSLQGHRAKVNAIAFHPDSSSLASASDDSTVRIWDMTNFQERTQKPITINGLVLDVLFQPPDGEYLVTRSGEFENPVRIWNASTGQELRTRLFIHDRTVKIIAFNVDGRYLAIGSKGDLAGIWDLGERHDASSLSKLLTLPQEKSVEALAFSPDSNYLAAAYENTVLLWDIANHRHIGNLAHKDKVTGVTFSPDGHCLATASADRTAILWLWRQEDLIQAACAHLSRNLSEKEWQLYMDSELYRPTCPNILPISK